MRGLNAFGDDRELRLRLSRRHAWNKAAHDVQIAAHAATDLHHRRGRETGVERLRLSSVEPMDFSDELLGLMAEAGLALVSLKLALVVVFVFLTNPLGAHVLTRAALRRGMLPWQRREPHVLTSAPPMPGTPGGPER